MYAATPAHQYTSSLSQDSHAPGSNHAFQQSHSNTTDPAYQHTGALFRNPASQSKFDFLQSRHTDPLAPAANYASRLDHNYAVTFSNKGSAALSTKKAGQHVINKDPTKGQVQ
jgi:hypothetical protein